VFARRGEREVRGFDTYGVLVDKGYIVHAPLIQQQGCRVHVQERGMGRYGAYAFGAHQALGYTSIRQLSYASAIPRPNLSYPA